MTNWENTKPWVRIRVVISPPTNYTGGKMKVKYRNIAVFPPHDRHDEKYSQMKL